LTGSKLRGIDLNDCPIVVYIPVECFYGEHPSQRIKQSATIIGGAVNCGDMSVRILCWNVNGIRAVSKKGFSEWLHRESPDILCVEEIKAQQEQLGNDLQVPEGYHVYWNSAEKKGYSGVAIFSKDKPTRLQYSFGVKRFDDEGRLIIAEYPGLILFNMYFPNGKLSKERLDYKMDFYDSFLDFIDPLLKEDKRLVVCGDFNTAHHEIDLARPRENEKVSGFLPIERAWMDKFVDHGFVDTFRHFNRGPSQYTWWDLKTRARDRNVGWRIDYIFISANLLGALTRAFIMPEVMGSDHCPIGIELDLDQHS
jgi:exodeoxyribonuclease-3